MQITPNSDLSTSVTNGVTNIEAVSQTRDDCDNVTLVTPTLTLADISGKTIDVTLLEKMDFPPPRWLVPGLLMDGNTLLAGAPKAGKTFFAMNVASGIALGSTVAGKIEVERQKVLYLTWRSEGDLGVFRQRLKRMTGSGYKRLPGWMFLGYNWPTFGAGAEEMFRAHMDREPETKLIIIDTFKRIREPNTGRRSAYDEDYEAFQPIASISDDYDVSFMVLHHTNKRLSAEDPFDLVSGSTGMTAAMDSVSIWKKREQGATLYMRGRAVEEDEIAFEFDAENGIWASLGSSEAHHRSETRNNIIDVLAASEDPLSPQEVSDLIDGSTYDNVRQTLTRMAMGGDYVTKVSRGKYTIDSFYKEKLRKKEAPF